MRRKESLNFGSGSLEAQAVSHYFDGTQKLFGIDLSIEPDAGLVWLRGPSGSGKTTLLNILGGITKPDAGCVRHGNTDIDSLTDIQRTDWRARNGYVFQNPNLVPGLNVAGNIMKPHQLRRTFRNDRTWHEHVLESTGTSRLLDSPVHALSGGQKQRVGIARALIHRPELVFADEPTAALDTHAKQEIHQLLHGISHALGVTVVMVSHDEIADPFVDRIVELRDGAVVS